MKHFTTRKQLDGMVKAVRDEAVAEAKKSGYPVIWSRGTWLCSADKDGQSDPCPEAEENVWDRTVAQIDSLIYRIEQDYPNIETIYLAGGYDGAASPVALRNGDYEPWISNWTLDVWSRNNEGEKS